MTEPSTILILGARSDIGAAIAKAFARHGYRLQLAAREITSLDPMRKDLEIRSGRECTLHVFDATDFASHQAFYASLPVQPDVVVYVAGYMQENEKALHDWNESLQTMQTNYVGAVSILNIVAADFRERKKGTIVGISSVAGNRGRQSNFIYGSSKAAFTAYLSGLRNQLFHAGVHVMTVLPGFVYTRMTEHLDLPAMLTAQPEEVGAAIYEGVQKKKDVIYVKWFWRYIMKVIEIIPESIFKKRRL